MNIKGQSVIELILFLPLFIAMWASMIWFAKTLIVSIELMHTARHGVFWLAYNHDPMSSRNEIAQVQRECRDFLRAQNPGLDLSRVTIVVDRGDIWQPIGPKNLFDIPGLLQLTTQLHRVLKDAAGLIRFQPASVRVEYALPSPPLLRAIPGFPKTVPLRGSCVCYR